MHIVLSWREGQRTHFRLGHWRLARNTYHAAVRIYGECKWWFEPGFLQ